MCSYLHNMTSIQWTPRLLPLQVDNKMNDTLLISSTGNSLKLQFSESCSCELDLGIAKSL